MDLKATRSGHETLGLGDDDLLKMYRCMLLARRVDERSWILNRQGDGKQKSEYIKLSDVHKHPGRYY